MKSHYRTMNKQRAEYIRELSFNKTNAYKQGELAKMFGMTQGSISRIVSGVVW